MKTDICDYLNAEGSLIEYAAKEEILRLRTENSILREALSEAAELLRERTERLPK